MLPFLRQNSTVEPKAASSNNSTTEVTWEIERNTIGGKKGGGPNPDGVVPVVVG